MVAGPSPSCWTRCSTRPSTYEDLAWIHDQWPGKVLVKGVQTVDDARRLADVGVDGIVLSNHGGRQLRPGADPVPPAARAWSTRSATTSRCTSTPASCPAQDIVAAVAHGAHFTLVGRAYLYGLMAGGRDGVDRAIEILRGQIERTMRLLGVASLDELEPGHVTQLQRLAPRDRLSSVGRIWIEGRRLPPSR